MDADKARGTNDAKATSKKTRRTPARRQRGESMTPEEILVAQETFLTEYARRGNVGAACDKARVHRSTIYRWLEHDEPFSMAYQQVKQDYCDVLRSEIHRRAREGWLEPMVSAGQLVTRVRKYSDVLLMFHAKALMPEYREKQQVEVSGSLDVNTLASEADAKFRAFLATLTAGRVLGQPDTGTEG